MSRAAPLLLAVAVRLLPRADRERYARELAAELATLPRGRRRTTYALGVLLHTGALRAALTDRRSTMASTSSLPPAAHPRSLRCRLHLHHFVWFSTDDGGRWRHCSRCGTDWGGDGNGWALMTYDQAARGEMGF